MEYNENDLNVWKYLYKNVRPLYDKFFCKKFVDNFKKLEKYYGLSENKIIQLRDIDEIIQKETGFKVKAVHGIISQRVYLVI